MFGDKKNQQSGNSQACPAFALITALCIYYREAICLKIPVSLCAGEPSVVVDICIMSYLLDFFFIYFFMYHQTEFSLSLIF